MTAAFIAIAGSVASLAAALWLAHRDDVRRHDRAVDDRIAARYRRPMNGRCWADVYSVPTPVRDYTHRYGAGVGTDLTAASGCMSEQTGRAAPAGAAHAGSMPTPRTAARGGVGLLALSRDTAPHPSPGRRRI